MPLLWHPQHLVDNFPFDPTACHFYGRMLTDNIFLDWLCHLLDEVSRHSDLRLTYQAPVPSKIAVDCDIAKDALGAEQAVNNGLELVRSAG